MILFETPSRTRFPLSCNLHNALYLSRFFSSSILSVSPESKVTHEDHHCQHENYRLKSLKSFQIKECQCVAQQSRGENKEFISKRRDIHTSDLFNSIYLLIYLPCHISKQNRVSYLHKFQ